MTRSRPLTHLSISLFFYAQTAAVFFNQYPTSESYCSKKSINDSLPSKHKPLTPKQRSNIGLMVCVYCVFIDNINNTGSCVINTGMRIFEWIVVMHIIIQCSVKYLECAKLPMILCVARRC